MMDNLFKEKVVAILHKQLDQLKAEKEELKKELFRLNSTIDFVKVTEHSAINKYKQFKQTLDEIKPVLELFANSKVGKEQPDGTYKIELAGISVRGYGTNFLIFDPRPAKEALQKISEVE